jgi:hypothetical protein
MSEPRLACTVVSFVPFPIKEEKPGLIPGRFFIKDSDTKEPEVLQIEKAIHFVYLDENRGSLQVRDPADEVARSIVEDFCTAQLGISEGCHPGIFWVPGAYSVKEIKEQFGKQCIEAKIAQMRWLTKICQIADDDWNKYHQHNVVSDFQRTAAHIIGWKPEEHEWMNKRQVNEDSTRCPACQTLVSPSLVVCTSCKCILRPEEYKKLQFAQ